MRPLVANYYLTHRCNASCIFCSTFNGIADEAKESTTEETIDHISELKDLGIAYLDITGGEPLLREDLPDILKAAKAKKLYVSLSTNCILFPDRAKDIVPHVDRLVFSLHSPIPDENDELRGAESFNSFINSVNIAKSLGKTPIINFTVTRDSVRFLPEMVELTTSLNALLWINPVFDYQDFGKFEPKTIEYIKYYSRNKSVSMNLAALEFLKGFGNSTIKPRCRAGKATITICPDNSLAIPCIKNKEGKVKIVGSIKQTLEANGELLSKDGKMDICSGCTMWTYVIPSFLYKIDKYFFLDLWSLLDLYRKDYRMNKGGKK